MKYRVNINLGEADPMDEDELELLQEAVEEKLNDIGYEDDVKVKIKLREEDPTDG